MKLPSPLACLALLSPGLLPAAQAAPREPIEPAVQRVVIEDEGSRIEELRVRGQTQRITVKTKGRLKGSYEILPPDGSRPPPSGPAASRGAAGQRVWHVLSF